MQNVAPYAVRTVSWVICIIVIQKIALSLSISCHPTCTTYLNRPALNSNEEDSIEYADGDDYDDKDDGNDVISVFGGVLQVAVKCRELSGTPSNHPS